MSFSFFRRSLQPQFEFTAGSHHTIWKLLVSASGVLTIDARQIEQKTMQLAALDIRSGKILWQNKRIEAEPWWIGMEKVERDVLLVHHFAKPDMPEPAGISALDLATGNFLWHNRGWKYLQSDDDTVLVTEEHFGVRKNLEVDIRRGEIICDLGNDESVIFQRMPSNPFLHCTFAEEFSEVHPSYGIVAPLVAELLPLERIKGSIDIAERGKFLVASYHHSAQNEGSVDNVLTVIDTSLRREVFGETLVRNAPAPVPENFFFYNDTLLFVKDRIHVVGVNLLIS